MPGPSASSCYIHAIGTAVPEPWLDPEGTARVLARACINARSVKLLQRVSRLTGIEKRHLVALNHNSERADDEALYRDAAVQPHGPGMGARSAVFDQEAGPLVLRALRKFPPESLARIGALVTVSCTHASSPGLDRPLLTETPIPSTVSRWNLGFMGCSAGLAGIRLVHSAAAMGRDSLVVACELSSLHFQYTDELDQMTANLLFADGAAAVLLAARPAPARVVDCRCVTLPQAAEQMVWFAGDFGLKLRLAQELPETLAAHLPAAVAAFLHDNGLSPAQVAHWLVHPGGPQILDAVEYALALRADTLQASRAVFREFGNMSSPTIFFIMQRVLDARAEGHAVAMAFGPGLTIELVLLHLSKTAVA